MPPDDDPADDRWEPDQIDYLEAHIAALEEWKAEQQRYLVRAASALLDAGMPESAGPGIEDGIRWLRADRDRLLAALKNLHGWSHCIRSPDPFDELDAVLAEATAAIADR